MADPRRFRSHQGGLLSERERQVLVGWLRNDTKNAVADELFILVATVNTHLARIREKYDSVGRPANNKVCLLIRAIEDGYCTLNDVARAVGGRPDVWGANEGQAARVVHLRPRSAVDEEPAIHEASR